MALPLQGLAARLIASAPPSSRAQLEAITQLEDRLHALYERGRAAWPDLDVTADAWVDHLSRHLAPQAERGLEVLHEDFYLAVAASLGLAGATGVFVRAFRPALLASLSRQHDRALADEVVALVEERLLVARPPAQAALSQYSGRGPLSRFLRAVAAHEVLNRVRVRRPEALTDDMVEFVVDAEGNPELRAMSRDSRRAFAAALHAAFRTLGSRERALVRMHAAEGATIDELGRVYGVHKVTAFRWLEDARLQLRNGTRRHLREVFALSETEIESLLGGSAATLEVSLRTMFTSRG